MSFQQLFENEVQKLTKKYISQFFGVLSKDFNIPEEELYKRWDGQINNKKSNSNETDYHKMKAFDLLQLCRSRKIKFASTKKCDTIRALEEDDAKKKESEKENDVESEKEETEKIESEKEENNDLESEKEESEKENDVE